MDLGLRDKVAIVTGASRGVGRAIALSLAAEGCRLAVVARGRKVLEETASELRNIDAEVLPIVADLLVAQDIEDGVVEAAREDSGEAVYLTRQHVRWTYGWKGARKRPPEIVASVARRRRRVVGAPRTADTVGQILARSLNEVPLTDLHSHRVPRGTIAEGGQDRYAVTEGLVESVGLGI